MLPPSSSFPGTKGFVTVVSKPGNEEDRHYGVLATGRDHKNPRWHPPDATSGPPEAAVGAGTMVPGPVASPGGRPIDDPELAATGGYSSSNPDHACCASDQADENGTTGQPRSLYIMLQRGWGGPARSGWSICCRCWGRLSLRPTATCREFAGVGKSGATGVELRSVPVCLRCGEPGHIQNQYPVIDVGPWVRIPDMSQAVPDCAGMYCISVSIQGGTYQAFVDSGCNQTSIQQSLGFAYSTLGEDYFTKCDFGSDLATFCDWTSEGLISTQTETGAQCQSGTQFWTDETTRCTCTDEQLTCSHIPLSRNDSTFGTCNVASDPHYTTFDGVGFHFVGPCTYILSRVCDKSGLLPEFAVEVQNEQRGDSPVSSIQQVNVNLQGLRVIMLRRERSRVMVNGILRNLPLHLNGNTVAVYAQADAVVLHTHFKLSVFYMRSGAVQVIVPSHYSNRICGMCGNFNQVTEDDFRAPNASLVRDARVLGQSWLATDAVCEEPTLPRVCSETEELKYASEVYCGVLTSKQGPFSECLSVLSAESFVRSCMFDMCTSHGEAEALCNAIQAFSDACNKFGITVPAWRNSTFCPLVCGPHSHHNACASGCPQTCSSLDMARLCGICEERCECDNGFLLSGGTCVPADDCGCWVNGQHYAIRETFMKGECESLCECLGHGKVHCSPVTCLADEVCMVKDVVMGCFPSSPVTCSIYGDPHYITFDGKAYSFWGTCNYTIAKTCGPSATQFTITARNEGQENSTKSSLNSIALDMEGLNLVIRKNRLVYVNGGQVSLPAEFGSSMFVSQSGPYVRVDTNFGLRLLFDGNTRLFVQVDERYRGVTCGLCGTYSGSQFDDFLKPDGNTVAHPHEFASSWNTNDSDWPCSNGSPDPPVCHPDLENAAFTECSALFGDAFSECHWFVPPQIYVSSCVSDYCTSQGDKAQLCTSLEDYVSACALAEVFLTDWRNHTLCAPHPSPLPTDTPKPTLSPASCPWSCNFDQDECGWEQLIQDSFDWTRWSGSTPSDLTGPGNDHTTGNGSYMYIEGDSVVHGDSARMISPVCNTPGKQCVSFWYHMYGLANAMSLKLYLFVNNHAVKIWSRFNNQGNHWYQGRVEIKPQQPFQIIVEGIRGSDPRSDVAIDDVTITFGACEYSSTEDFGSTTLAPPLISSNSNNPHPVCGINCDFESDICSWTQLLTDVFDWTRHTGSTSSSMTGPSSDHTTGSGFYIYIKGDSATHGDTARLLSLECADPQPQCLQFWYHIYGTSSTMGLSVYMLEENVSQEVWRRRENHGDMWHRALVNLSPKTEFQVIFEGRIGSTALSDVAVDDVSLYRGTCDDLISQVTLSPGSQVSLPPASTTLQPTPIQTTTTTRLIRPTTTTVKTTGAPVQTTVRPIQPINVPNSRAPICSINCDFESDICSWTQLLTDVFDWTRHTGSTPSSMTGPSSDHTTGSGFYIYIEGDSATYGDTARLLSSECADPQPQCLQFWYHAYGTSSTMGLSIYLLEGNKAQEVWRRRENHGDMWHRALVNMSPKTKFQIIFEGRIGSTALSDVAIDDVSLHRGTCDDLINQETPSPTSLVSLPPASTTPQPAPIQTTTTTVQTTVRPSQPTDVPNTPAPICGINCDFESDICSWTQLLTDVFDWTRHTGSTPSPMTGPSFDHTTGSGFYIYIEGDSAIHGDTARLLSSECADPQPQCLQFWYHIYGTSSTMGLSVYLLEGNVAQEVWRRRENHRDMWHRALVNMSPKSKFQVIFEGRIGSTALSDVAIDDVSLHRGTCDDLNQVNPSPTSQWSTNNPVTPPVGNVTVQLTPTSTTLQTTVTPLQTTNAPIANTDNCIPTTTELVQTTAATVQTTAIPSHTTVGSIQSTAAPIQTTVAHVQTTAEPVQTTIAPIQSTAKPIQTTAEPVQTTVKPIQTTDEPVLTTASPIQTTTESVQTTDAPIQTTDAPIQTTAAPVQTTAKPIKTTDAPIQTTARPIQTTGIPISTPPCPANSHNTDCVPACLPTCAHLHGPPDCNTDEPCVQGCVCDDGFVLKQRVCVPIHECGCQDSHGNNHYFGEVWYDNHCSQRCECEEANDEGEIQCEEYECDKDEICHMTEQGEYSCWETDFNKCKIDDDPEYKTFDNMKHKFKGKHSYILVQTTALPSNFQDVYVVGINKKINDKSSEEDDSSDEDDSSEEDDDGRVRALRIRVYNHTVEFKKGRKITVDGLSVKPPVSPCEGMKIWERSSRVYLKTDFGLSVEFNGKGKAEITLPQTYKRKIGGLCGNFDGSSKNDMMKPNGEQAKNVKEFGESWRVTVDKIIIRQRRSSLLHAWLRA
ncbi:zonadhesin [Myxocyprinus asiaticus]|uniref:zonadhesin n=1 Tax=Myxocyprinus asiaticus TaxID=70543 RepID=UPI0022238170|nr:zonadhesin [Myxocyprinus asiaticus]